jgi:trans-aconitate methyltransferase
MSYKGYYKPSYPNKYKGDPNNIVYRSLWERKFMVYCDTNENILEWGSEEIVVPYKSPVDNRYHRYFPDFYIKYKDVNGKIKKSNRR